MSSSGLLAVSIIVVSKIPINERSFMESGPRPEGAKQNSEGQRLGNEVFIKTPALKGPHKTVKGNALAGAATTQAMVDRTRFTRLLTLKIINAAFRMKHELP